MRVYEKVKSTTSWGGTQQSSVRPDPPPPVVSGEHMLNLQSRWSRRRVQVDGRKWTLERKTNGTAVHVPIVAACCYPLLVCYHVAMTDEHRHETARSQEREAT
jgi:hypothetical protein